jgi:hypothetical protein
MPIIARSESHSNLVGIMTFVLVAIMLIHQSATDRNLVALVTQLKPSGRRLSRKKPLRAWDVPAYRWRELMYLQRQGERDQRNKYINQNAYTPE